jgi:hypothetical protein
MMQNALLKTASGPFDWIFSSLRMVNHCIATDFEMFLDRTQYVPIPNERRSNLTSAFCDHRFYHERCGIATMFNHSDPTLPDVYDYMTRCVDRFRRALRSDQPNLLLGIAEPHRITRGSFRRLAQKLDRFDNAEAMVMIIGRNVGARRVRLVETIGRHRLFVLNVMSPLHGIQFADHEDNRFVIDQLSTMLAIAAPDQPGREAEPAHSAASSVSAA